MEEIAIVAIIGEELRMEVAGCKIQKICHS